MVFSGNWFVVMFIGLPTRKYIISSITCKYMAITDHHESFVNSLYLREWNASPPDESDPATTNALIRFQLCEEISNSGVFIRYNLYPLVIDETLSKLKSYSNTREYSPSDLENKLTKPYQVHTFKAKKFNPRYQQNRRNLYDGLIVVNKEEFAFECANLQRQTTEELVPFYISKEYNKSHTSGCRFIFLTTWRILMVAEESAQVYEVPNFNVELHYLELKKHLPASGSEADPVRNLRHEYFSQDQSFRLCVSVLTSSYFEGKIIYPHRLHWNLVDKEVSFRTPEAQEIASEESYKELMLPCYASTAEESEDEMFYISRAYNPNQVFVFTRDLFTNELYIENLTTNVNIVHDNYNFNHVEI